MPSPKFVKFQRGSAAAYDALSTKDLDTLYFIYDVNDASAGGLLYLGETLIGGTGSMIGSSTLAGLTDIDLTGLTDGALLQYNAVAQQWEVASPNNLSGGGVSVIVGSKNSGETVAQAQSRLNSSPNAGDVLIIDGEPYIYSDAGQWKKLTSTDISSRVLTLETKVGTLETQMNGVDTKISEAISNANHLTYQVVGTLGDVDTAIANNASGLNRTIFLVPNGDQTGNLYDEYMVVNNTKERLGDFRANLNNYVTTTQLSTEVGTLNQRIDGLSATFGDYLTVQRFENEVGSLSDFLTATGKSSTTVFNELESIESDITALYAMLEWNELNN